jgi:hypothetical protein
MAFWQWSKTATANATSDPTINWSEGIAPSIVDDNNRAGMARLSEYRDDTSGLLVTAGTSTAYTLTTNQGLPSTPNNGQLIVFTPHVANGAAATLSADVGTAFPLQSAPGTALAASALTLGVPVAAKFLTASSAWVMFGAATTGVANGVAVGSVTGAGIASGTITGANLSTNLKTAAIEYFFDGQGSNITVGKQMWLEVPFSCTLTAFTAVIAAGTIVTDVWRANGALPTSSGQSIVGGGNTPQTGSYTHQALSGWTSVAVAAGDIVLVNVTSSSTLQGLISLNYTKT